MNSAVPGRRSGLAQTGSAEAAPAMRDGCVARAGLAQPGKIQRGARAGACTNHLHQLHVCLPAGPGRTQLLYRMSLDFLGWTRAVPGIQAFWRSIANQARAWPLPLSPAPAATHAVSLNCLHASQLRPPASALHPGAALQRAGRCARDSTRLAPFC